MADGGLDSRTALVILPPAEFTTEVQVLRQRHDRAFARWPPHLRICWPFVPVRTALARFGQTRLTIPAFDLGLASVGLLNSEAHGDRDRVYVALQPSTASVQSLDLLRREVLRIFPECEAGDAGDAFHLTLGQLPLGEAESLVNSAESSLELPLKWRCESVTLMACHSSAEPLKPMHEIQLAETSRPFEPPPRLAGSWLPSLAWRSVLKALPLRDASRMARALEHQDVGRADWWSELTEDFFGEGCNQGLSTFCSLVGAAGFASNLSWAAVPNSAGEVEVCKGVQDLEDPPAAREVVPLLSGSARCARHTSSRVAVLGALGKESSLALWNLNSHEKPRFNKLKGHVASFDLWEELLLVLGKGGSLSLHDLTDPRSQATSLGKKDDGHALAVHWMHGRAVVAYPKKVALINVESGAAESLPSLCDPVLCPLDEQLLAVATGTSWLLWDVRRPSNVAPVPSGFRCQALARLDDTSALAAGDGALWWMDLRMERWSRWVQLPKRADRDVSVKCLLPGHSCVSAQFEDQTLATWHRGSGIRMGWWPSSRCLSLPSGEAAWDGIAAADTQLYLAGVSRNGGSSSRAEGKKVDAKKVPKPDAKKEVKGHAKKVDATSAKGASQKSQKLRTSEDVYHRILHDSARFDPKDIAIGYEDRFLGPMELQLVDFKPGGDLPFHRIYYFRRGAEVLWDRKHRLDRIFNEMGTASSVAAETVEAIRRAQRTAEKIEQGLIKVRGRGGRKAAPPPVEVAGMRYVAEKDCWMPCPAMQSVRLEELKVLTLNVLFELYGDVETHLQVRMAHIFAELQKSEADVILLQEVTPSFAEMLLQQLWVRDHYWSSCGEQTDSVDPSGQLTLSKWPVRSVLCARLSQHKTVVLTTILASLGRARAVLVANLHLAADLLDASGPSSRQEHRAEQLKTCEEVLHDRLRPGDLGLIAGDFNDAAPVLSGEFLDAWVEANPQEEGSTFDPTVNRVAQQVVAAVNGRTEPRRIDRIYVAAGAGAEGGWLMDARLVGTEAFYEASIESGKQPWYLSDHFGVLCKIRAAVAAGAEERVLLHKPADVLQPEVLEALSLGSEVELVLLGSAALGIADAGSDVDLLACSASLSQPRFFARAAEALAAVGADVECASDATVPLIRFQAKDGRQVEVQFMELSAEHILQLRDSHTAVDAESHAFEALEAQLFVPKESMQVSLAAALDVWALSRQLGGRFELFRQLAVAVKRWARKRQLLGTAFGFPGGFAWALMASREVLLSPDDDVQKIQATFFQNAAKKLSDEAPKLWCPAGPQDRNALRSMTRGTAQILRAQLEVPLGGTGPLEAPRFLVVEMAAAAETKARLQRKAIPILLEVERCAQGTAWPLTDVHCSRRGMPCLVMGLESWTPTAGEQRATAKSMKTSTGLDVEVRLVSADHLRAEIPSVTE